MEKPDEPKRRPPRGREPHPLLHQLAEWHPQLFGARFAPLKLGIFEELQQRHPEVDKAQLKGALAWHARSTPYLETVAAGQQRHDLDGQPVEDVAPEHRHHAIMEVFRRRQARAKQDLKPWLVDRLVQAIDASALAREAYAERVRVNDPEAQQALDDAFAAIAERTAKREAVRRAFAASGRSVAEFAEMYGMDVSTVREAVE
jgi:ProP effector